MTVPLLTGHMAGVDVSRRSLPDRVAVLSPCLLGSTSTVFSVRTGPPSVVLEAADVVRGLHRQLPEEKEDFLLFTVLRVDTAGAFSRVPVMQILVRSELCGAGRDMRSDKCSENLPET